MDNEERRTLVEESTGIEMAEEIDIEKIHERKGIQISKPPNCQHQFCKAAVISIAIVVFIAMMIQIW